MIPMIDHERLAGMAQGCAVAQAEILTDFRRINAQDFSLLRQAARDADFTHVGILAHRMKGAGVMLGAGGLSETCSLVSMAARACDPGAVERAVTFLEREIEALDEYLSTQCNSTTAMPVIPPAAAASPKAVQICSDLRFIVVEDHAFQRRLIVKFLLRMGAADVRGFADGGEALQALRLSAADIMVLDLAMPGIDGMDVMRALSATTDPVSVILNSALSPSQMASLIQGAKKSYGINLLGAVSKPMTEQSLAPLIAKYRSARHEPAGQQVHIASQLTGKTN